MSWVPNGERMGAHGQHLVQLRLDEFANMWHFSVVHAEYHGEICGGDDSRFHAVTLRFWPAAKRLGPGLIEEKLVKSNNRVAARV